MTRRTKWVVAVAIGIPVVLFIASLAWNAVNGLIAGTNHVTEFTTNETLLAQTNERLGVVARDLDMLASTRGKVRERKLQPCSVDSGDLFQPSAFRLVEGTLDDIATRIAPELAKLGWRNITPPGQERFGRQLGKDFGGWAAQTVLFYDSFDSHAIGVEARIEGAEPCTPKR